MAAALRSAAAAALADHDEDTKRCLLPDDRPLDAPINSIAEKWRLLPAFLKVRGLVKQHLDSFNHLVTIEIKHIVHANNLVTSDADPNFYLKFLDVYLGEPSVEEEYHSERTWESDRFTPQECRLRDITYSAPVKVDVEYTVGATRKLKRGVPVGRMPIMLRSRECMLHGRTDAQLARMGECPIDPGGYFVVKGQEKVILIQEQVSLSLSHFPHLSRPICVYLTRIHPEYITRLWFGRLHTQLSKNRIIVDRDSKGQIHSAVTSSTHERKSKTHIVFKNGCFALRHNTFTDDIPIVVLLKAMGVTSDQEVKSCTPCLPPHATAQSFPYITPVRPLNLLLHSLLILQVVQLVGSDVRFAEAMAASLQECAKLRIFSQARALEYISKKVRAGPRGDWQRSQRRSRLDEARELLAHVILAHVPVLEYNFWPKIVYVAQMLRRMVAAENDPNCMDDMDYYGLFFSLQPHFSHMSHTPFSHMSEFNSICRQ